MQGGYVPVPAGTVCSVLEMTDSRMPAGDLFGGPKDDLYYFIIGGYT
jgi:hypothetical protein